MWPARRYFSASQRDEIVAAIERAEKGSAGEVRIHIENRCKGDPLDRAATLFRAMCMSETAGDTGVLLYVAANSHKAAVWAGAGVHGAADAAFWQGVIDTVAAAYRDGTGASGIVAAIDRIGELLREHIPGRDTAGNELPNEVTTS